MNSWPSPRRSRTTKSSPTTGAPATTTKSARSIEAGLMLTGPEVKSLRSGKATVAESYAAVDRNGELMLYNANIPEYLQANRFNHEPRRPRKLLLHAKEIAKLAKGVEREGMTIVPLARLFQRQGPRQDRHRARARQEAARQARGRKDPRLEPRQVAADAREGVRRGLRRDDAPGHSSPSLSKDFQAFPKKFQGNSKLFQTFPRISKLFPWPFRGKSRGYRSVDRESRFLQFLRRLGRGQAARRWPAGRAEHSI